MLSSCAMPNPDARPATMVSGLAWDYAGTAIYMGSQVAVLMVLSRLLTPREFGIAAIVTLVTTFAALLCQFGIIHALVQIGTPSSETIRTSFTATAVFGIFTTGLILIAALPIASYFHEPELGSMLRLVSPYFLLVALGTTAEAQLQRSMDFRRLALANIGAYILGYAIVAIALASLGFGVRSLIIALVVQAFLKSIAVFVFHPHDVRPLWDRTAANHLIRFGGAISLSKLLNSAATQGDNAVVGRALGSEVLGLYSRAYQLILLPANFIGQTLNKVLFAAWSRDGIDQENLRNEYLNATAFVTAIAGAFAAIYLVLGQELVEIALGPQWAEVSPPLKVLSVALVARTAYKVDDSLAIAKGRVKARIHRDGLYAGLVVVLTWAGSRFAGLLGASIGVSLAIAINHLLAVTLSLRLTDTTRASYVTASMPGYVVAAIFGLSMLCVRLILAHVGIGGSIQVVALSLFLGGIATTSIAALEPRLLGGRIRGLLATLYSELGGRVRIPRLVDAMIRRMRA